MNICEKRGWGYAVTLKDAQLPTLQEQVSRALRGGGSWTAAGDRA